ncbi:hypothetical protein EYF80_057411 [Liparis tanakae]|uniref:Uncharacterized protein n=1 Tax=Liparis tanakae TaxID=230148 RepID=A0A4Z2EUI9_9TELE|nr:hypothetical protein EYF80_057411 [Liparis tanakae]
MLILSVAVETVTTATVTSVKALGGQTSVCVQRGVWRAERPVPAGLRGHGLGVSSHQLAGDEQEAQPSGDEQEAQPSGDEQEAQPSGDEQEARKLKWPPPRCSGPDTP